jgi:hypothetical protein
MRAAASCELVAEMLPGQGTRGKVAAVQQHRAGRLGSWSSGEETVELSFEYASNGNGGSHRTCIAKSAISPLAQDLILIRV